MEPSFEQDIHSFVSKDLTDFMPNNFLEGNTNSECPAIKKETEQVSNPSFPPVLKEHKQVSSAAILNIENAFNLLIKEEPEIDAYEIENVPLEVPENVYAKECLKQGHKLLGQLKNKVTEQNGNVMGNLVHIPYSHNNDNRQLVVSLENLKVIEREGNLMVDNLEWIFKSALNRYNNNAPVKIESNSTGDLERSHKITFKEWKIKNEDLNIKEELEEIETRVITSTSKRSQLEPQLIVKLKKLKIVGKDGTFKVEHLNEGSGTDLISYSPNCIGQNSLNKYAEDVPRFRCHQCSYKTILKCDLKKHLLRHPEEVETFKCNKCAFQTGREKMFKAHQRRHNNSEEVQKYQCNQCFYKSKFKANLKWHLFKHKKPEEIEMLKCTNCDFQTIHKRSLQGHVLLHNVDMLKCNKCSFRTTSKKHLNSHLLCHKEKKFKCNQCSYTTIFKFDLNMHLFQHKNPDAEIFKCYKCDFQTRLDAKLQWGSHISQVAKKLTKAVFVLRGLSSCVSPAILRTAYFALFQSHVSYAILAWGHSAEVYRLFAIQRRVVRVISNLGYRDDCRGAFVALQILTLPALYILQNLLFIKKADNFKSHTDIHDYNTRKKNNLVPLWWRLGRCQDGPGYWAIKFYNVLPESIRNLPYKQFSSRMKEILTDNAFYSYTEFLNFNVF